jgi:hypothetical protein
MERGPWLASTRCGLRDSCERSVCPPPNGLCRHRWRVTRTWRGSPRSRRETGSRSSDRQARLPGDSAGRGQTQGTTSTRFTAQAFSGWQQRKACADAYIWGGKGLTATHAAGVPTATSAANAAASGIVGAGLLSCSQDTGLSIDHTHLAVFRAGGDATNAVTAAAIPVRRHEIFSSLSLLRVLNVRTRQSIRWRKEASFASFDFNAKDLRQCSLGAVTYVHGKSGRTRGGRCASNCARYWI